MFVVKGTERGASGKTARTGGRSPARPSRPCQASNVAGICRTVVSGRCPRVKSSLVTTRGQQGKGRSMRPREGERRGRFPSGMVRKFLSPPTPDPPPPRVKENTEGGEGAPEGRESCRDRPYMFERSLLPPGARTELRLYRCSPEFVRTLLALAVLCCPCVARPVVSRLSWCAGRFPFFSGRSRLLRYSVPTISHKTDPRGPLPPREYQ